MIKKQHAPAGTLASDLPWAGLWYCLLIIDWLHGLYTLDLAKEAKIFLLSPINYLYSCSYKKKKNFLYKELWLYFPPHFLPTSGQIKNCAVMFLYTTHVHILRILPQKLWHGGFSVDVYLFLWIMSACNVSWVTQGGPPGCHVLH